MKENNQNLNDSAAVNLAGLNAAEKQKQYNIISIETPAKQNQLRNSRSSQYFAAGTCAFACLYFILTNPTFQMLSEGNLLTEIQNKQDYIINSLSSYKNLLQYFKDLGPAIPITLAGAMAFLRRGRRFDNRLNDSVNSRESAEKVLEEMSRAEQEEINKQRGMK